MTYAYARRPRAAPRFPREAPPLLELGWQSLLTFSDALRHRGWFATPGRCARCATTNCLCLIWSDHLLAYPSVNPKEFSDKSVGHSIFH